MENNKDNSENGNKKSMEANAEVKIQLKYLVIEKSGLQSILTQFKGHCRPYCKYCRPDVIFIIIFLYLKNFISHVTNISMS